MDYKTITFNYIRCVSVNDIYKRGRGGHLYINPTHKKFRDDILEIIEKENVECIENDDIHLIINIFLKGKKKLDIDNCLKSLFDALQGHIFENDAQVAKLNVDRVVNSPNNKIIITYAKYNIL